MIRTLRARWPEYLSEAAALALFMVSASLFATVLEHYRSPLQALLPNPLARRALMGAAMGLTAAGIIYSPLGARSGAHMNPSVTLAFVRLGKVARADAGFYIFFQFAGGLAGMLAAHGVLGELLAEPAVDFVLTRPGSAGELVAAAGELTISFAMMSVLLRVAANPRTERLTGAAAGVLVFTWITFEGPLSGMSMNPARTLGPALLAGSFEGLWLYFVAPPLGMLLAADLYRRRAGAHRPCAKLNHSPSVRCIFCGFTPRREDREKSCITT